MNIIFYIAGCVFAVSTVVFLAGIFRKVMAGQENVEGASTGTPAGTRKQSLIWMLIFAGIMVFATACAEKSSLTTTTIGQFHEEISALADKTPTSLVYTESIGSPETFSAVVDDPAIAKQALDIILSASVDKRGCQVDMYQMQYVEYCFVFGEETYTFGFVPQSYFCYDSRYYELGENRLDQVHNYLHEMTAEMETAMEPQSKWYSDDAVLQTNFVDNGDEARSVTELTLLAGEETITGVIEGAYDVLSVEKQPDGYVICYTYGDFYSHEEIRSSRITVENGELVITDIAQ